MTLPAQRPATARVLAALAERGDEDRWHAWATAYDLRVSLGCVERAAAPGAWSVLSAWRHADPGEAWEALQTAGLAPPDDERRRWWCPTCGGSSARDDGHCPDCSSIGTRSAPPDLPTLVAVAAIGVGDWLRAEALAREVERDAVVVWRVMTAAALNDHFSRERGSRPPGAEVGAALVFALEDREEMGGDAWTEECPYAAPPVRRMWPALRGIARNEDGSPTGVHLVAHEPGRVTLAVESLS